MKLTIMLGCVALFVGACAGPKQQGGAREMVAFSTAFDVLEVRQGSKTAVKPGSRLVDYESSIVVRPDKAALAELIPLGSDSDPNLRRARVEALNKEIADAQALVNRLGELTSVIDTITDYERASIELYTEVKTGSVRANDARYGDLAKKRLPLVEKLEELAKLHAEVVVVGTAIDWKTKPAEDATTEEEERFERNKAAKDQAYTLMAPDPSGDRNRYDASQVTRVLNETSAALRKQLEKLESAVEEKAPKAELDMEAALLRGGQRLPISIAPYTIVEGEGRGAKSPRIGVPGKDDVQRVRKGYEAYSEMATAMNGLKDTAGDDQARQALLDGVAEQLKQALGRLRDRLLMDVEAFAKEDGPIPAAREAAKALRGSLVELERDIRAIVDAPDAASRLFGALALVNSLREGRLKTLRNQFDALTAALASAAANAATASEKYARQLKEAIEAEAQAITTALDGVPGGADVASLFRSLKVMSELAHAREFSKLDPGRITKKAFALESASDGFIDLGRTEADDGDKLAVTYRVVVDPNSKDTRREFPGSATLDVRKFGFYTTLKSQLLFYNRIGDGSDSFRAAPGIAYNFHYRPESHFGFFDTVAPGLGVSVSSPSFEEGAELAIGLQFTFFNDMLQAGYAHNISVSDDAGMVYFGLDLIGAFQKAK